MFLGYLDLLLLYCYYDVYIAWCAFVAS